MSLHLQVPDNDLITRCDRFALLCLAAVRFRCGCLRPDRDTEMRVAPNHCSYFLMTTSRLLNLLPDPYPTSPDASLPPMTARSKSSVGTYRVDGNDLGGGSLHLAELAQEVEEARLGDRLVGGEEAHAVEGRLSLGLGREPAANDKVLVEASHFRFAVGGNDA